MQWGAVYTASPLPAIQCSCSCSVFEVYTAESEKCICSIYCTSTALRSGNSYLLTLGTLHIAKEPDPYKYQVRMWAFYNTIRYRKGSWAYVSWIWPTFFAETLPFVDGQILIESETDSFVKLLSNFRKTSKIWNLLQGIVWLINISFNERPIMDFPGNQPTCCITTI